MPRLVLVRDCESVADLKRVLLVKKLYDSHRAIKHYYLANQGDVQ